MATMNYKRPSHRQANSPLIAHTDSLTALRFDRCKAYPNAATMPSQALYDSLKGVPFMRLKYFVLAASLVLLVAGILVSYHRKDLVTAYNKYRLMLLDGGGEQCIAELRGRGVEFQLIGDTGSDTCPIKNAVKVSGFKNTKPSSPFVLSCPTLVTLNNWLDENSIKSFKHMGTINCRKMRGRGFQSEHSYGTAIDISVVDGASVERDWGEDSARGKRLAEVASSACRHFSHALTPETNRLHHNHFHFDDGFGGRCDS